MTTKDEALKLALEALENSVDLVEQDYDNAVSLYGNYPPRAKRLIGMETMRDDHRKAIATLREALAEQHLAEPCRCGKQTNAWCMANTCSKAEQPAPVAKPHEQDPGRNHWEDGDVFERIAARNTPPAQRQARSADTWVGLTNNELQPIADEYHILFGSWVEDFARAIEAKLREKNT